MSNVAEVWWSYVVHATWQSALLGVVLLGLVWALRRLPASLRYGLLLVALLKFAVPPMMAFPTGAFSRPQVAAVAAPVGARVIESRPEFDNPPVLSSLDAEPAVVPPESRPATTWAEVEVAAQDVREEAQVAAAPPASLPSPVVEPSDSHAVVAPAPATSRPAWMTWKTLLLLVHGIGCIVVAWCIARTCRAIRRLTRSSRVVTDGPLHILLKTIAERLGLGREVRLLLAPPGTPPMAFGMLRPTVILPENLTQQLGGDRLTALLAHELAHHRRRDPLFMVLENLLLLAWWFNPVLWLVLKAVRRTREDCCDDLVLAHGIADNETYCDSLVQAASAMIGPSPVGAALGFADRLHPLGRRLQRIMDATIRRPRRLPLAGLVAVVVLGLVALPGLRMVNAEDRLARGLVAYYPFDGDATDHSGHGHDGAVLGDAAFVAGADGRALSFSGAGDYVEFGPVPSELLGSRPKFAGLWFRPRATGTRGHFFFGAGVFDPEQDGPGYSFRLVTDHSGHLGIDASYAVAHSSIIVDNDVWNYVFGYWDGNQFYAGKVSDGVVEREAIDMSSWRSPRSNVRQGSLRMGHIQYADTGARGAIDEARVYDRVLSDEEILSLYNRAASAPGLAAYYPLDGDARDASGNGNHGVVSGASPTANRFGKADSALHFSGNGSGVECPSSDSLNIHGRTSLTIGAWIRAERNDVGRHQGLVWKWGAGMAEDDQFVFGLQNQGGYFGLSDIPSRVTSGPLPVGGWFSLVGVYDAEGKRLKLYVNGELETTKRLDSVIRGTTQPLYLGKAESRRSFFQGDLDEVRIYNRALMEDEIGELYGGPVPKRPQLTVVAPSSQGKGEADAAAHRLTVQAKQAPGEEWQATGLTFRSGAKVMFSANGKAKWDPGLPSVTPQGGGRTPLGSTGRPHEFLAPSAPCGGLVGKIGEDGAPFFIGESLTHIVVHEGELFLGVNDRVPHFMDNDGEFEVYVALSTAQHDKPVQGTAQSREAGGQAIETEIRVHYAKADAETQDYIRRTAQSFGRGRLWFAADAFDSLTDAQREEKVKHIVNVLNGEYGRGLCGALAEAGALQDRRLLPGLMKVAAYHRDDTGYDCRAKWMAVAALGRQDDESAVPILVPLLDHGNENTRIWALASLVRLTGQNLGADKKAWAKWWNESGKEPRIDASQLRPWVPPPGFGGAPRAQLSRTVPAGGIGPQGGVLRFDGKDDFIHIPSAPQFDIKGDLTVSAWVRADPDCRDSGIFRRGDAQPAHDPYSLGAHPGKMAFDIGGGPGNTRDTARAAADLDKEWHCWTGVRDSGAGKLRLYKDGQLVSEVDDALPYEYPTSRMYNEIGACDAGRWGSWGYFKGEIDQVSVWKIPLESEQVRALFAQGAKGDEPGLVGLWLFDEEGQTVKDSSSFGCHVPLGRTPEPDASDPTRIALPAAISQAARATGAQSGISGTHVATVQATTPGFDGWYLDLETLAQPEGIGTGRSARNLLLTKELVPGARWRFVGKDQGFLIQAIAAPYDGWCLHYDEAKEPEMIEGWASVRNLILAEKPSPSTHWTLTKTGRGHLIQASAGRYRGWYLDLAAGEEPSTIDGYLSCRNLVLSEELPAGGYWKLTATQKAASGTEPEASQVSPSDAAKLSDEKLRGLVSSDNRACREVRNRHRKSLPYLDENWRGRLPIWEEAAKRGIPEGRVLLGLCHGYGVGVEKAPAKEAELMLAAARAGEPTAMFNLAQAYTTGNGIERDIDEGLNWYWRAAELGDSGAMWHLGWCRQHGRFLPQDHAKAAEWYRRSAEKGNARGMLLLGDYLLASDGGAREQAEGIEWIRRAAELGYEEAGARLRGLERQAEQ